MIDSRFYHSQGPLSLRKIAEISGAELLLTSSTSLHEESKINSVSSLEDATSQDLAMFHNPKYKEAFRESKAGACFISSDMAEYAPPSMALFIHKNPQRAFAAVASTLYPTPEGLLRPMTTPIHPSVQLGENVVTEYGVIIKEGVKVGKNTCIGANTVIGAGVVIGENCHIAPNVTLSHALIGNNVTIFPGVCIGQAGFGFVMDEQGYIPFPQLGRVILEDNVEIGANTTIDRGSLRDTIIGQGSRIDNLVMIAHNVVLGKGCILVGQVGIAGSTTLGNYVIAAGQVGISGHLKIGDRVRIGAKSCVIRNVKEGETITGIPAVSHQDFLRQAVTLAKITKEHQDRKKKNV